jgi:hypothetical protein
MKYAALAFGLLIALNVWFCLRLQSMRRVVHPPFTPGNPPPGGWWEPEYDDVRVCSDVAELAEWPAAPDQPLFFNEDE